MSQAHFIKAQVVGRPVSHRSVFVEKVVALIVVTLAFAVLICLAAIAPDNDAKFAEHCYSP
jgi:hypothetical protein